MRASPFGVWISYILDVLKLHYHPGNASLAPHILLEELGLPYELVYVDRASGAHKAPAYLALNPNGLIPVLVDAELVLYETAAICLHLVDKHADAGLAPTFASQERAHFYKWLSWLSSTLQPVLMQRFYPERLLDPGNAAGCAQIAAHAEAKVTELLQQLEVQLAHHGGPWLLGANYSAVDPYALMLCRWTRGFAAPARALPQVGSYLGRLLSRAPVQRALTQEKRAPASI